MSDLAEFLLARIAEDEDEARERREIADRHWAEIRAAGATPAFVVFRTDEPEFTLATCAAHRRIVELHGSGDAWCDHCSGYSDEPSDTCPTIRALASVYVDHPDYQPEWS